MLASTTEEMNYDSDTITECSDTESMIELRKCSRDYLSNVNVVNRLRSRELYGRIARHNKARTEPLFEDFPKKCSTYLSNVLPLCSEMDVRDHTFMGFTLCSRYVISYTANFIEGDMGPYNMFGTVEYTLYIWKVVPYRRFRLASKHVIFRHAKTADYMHDVSFTQWPGDCYKLICYGKITDVQTSSYVTILTIPTTEACISCTENKNIVSGMHEKRENEKQIRNFCNKNNISEGNSQGWCLRHGFTVDYMFSLQTSYPGYVPEISLAYSDHIVINTGHHIHILNMTPAEIQQPLQPLTLADLIKNQEETSRQIQNDNFSERSETPNSVVEAIIQDFNEYDLEPFHELNISCEPLNVTGKNYHNFNLKPKPEQPKIDKKIAEKAYEFTEENEKFEKFSSFRKKRFADKKYEFSEDNSENIVPFNSLRHQRRYLYRSQSNRCLRPPDVTNIYFLSPLSPGLRSPILSPNSRNIYYPSLRSPHYSKSPLSPRDSARKFNVYSPSLCDSDCSDADSRLVLKNSSTSNNSGASSVNHQLLQHQQQNGLLIAVGAVGIEDPPGWIKKVVRRYSSLDFDTSSLVSGQSRDDFNTPIELPLLVNPLVEHDIDAQVSKSNPLNETELIVSQRTFDCELFLQRRAEQLCEEAKIHFTHCEDYDICLLHICPLTGDIICGVAFKIGALKKLDVGIPQTYFTSCMFIWNIETDSVKVIESNGVRKLTICDSKSTYGYFEQIKFPQLHCKKPLVMKHIPERVKLVLRDYNNCVELCLDPAIPNSNQALYEADVYYVFYTSDSDDE